MVSPSSSSTLRVVVVARRVRDAIKPTVFARLALPLDVGRVNGAVGLGDEGDGRPRGIAGVEDGTEIARAAAGRGPAWTNGTRIVTLCKGARAPDRRNLFRRSLRQPYGRFRAPGENPIALTGRTVAVSDEKIYSSTARSIELFQN